MQIAIRFCLGLAASFALVAAQGCSLLAPSDAELSGGVRDASGGDSSVGGGGAGGADAGGGADAQDAASDVSKDSSPDSSSGGTGGGSAGSAGDAQTDVPADVQDVAVDPAPDSPADAPDGDGAPCVADCEGAICGNDGCNGSCGSCSGENICSQSRQCVAIKYPASGLDIGTDYHATSTDFVNSTFLSQYNNASIRSAVQAQLAGMASAGASVISTRLWMVSISAGATDQPWELHYPLNSQELTNLRTYVQDVAAAGLKLYVVMLRESCADYTQGTPETTLGACGLTESQFVATEQQAASGVLGAVRDVFLPDGRPVVERVYFEGELTMAAGDSDPATAYEKKNQRWFIGTSGLWQWFSDEARKVGVIPSVYFTTGQTEAELFNDTFVDGYLPNCSGHQSMYWIYRGLIFMKTSGLPVPDRIDFSSYPVKNHLNYASLYNRIFSDFEAIIPTLLGVSAVDYTLAETFYSDNQWLRDLIHKGIAAQFILRPNLRGACHWTTPADPNGSSFAAPFIYTSFATANIHQMAYPNPSFETAGGAACGIADIPTAYDNPANYCTEWPNGNVTAFKIGQNTTVAKDGAASLELNFGQCATSPCSSGAYPGIYVISDPGTGAVSGDWALSRFWGRYTGSDYSPQLVLVTSTNDTPDTVPLVTSNNWLEYVLLGQASSVPLSIRAQVYNPTNTNTHAYIDLLH